VRNLRINASSLIDATIKILRRRVPLRWRVRVYVLYFTCTRLTGNRGTIFRRNAYNNHDDASYLRFAGKNIPGNARRFPCTGGVVAEICFRVGARSQFTVARRFVLIIPTRTRRIVFLSFSSYVTGEFLKFFETFLRRTASTPADGPN